MLDVVLDVDDRPDDVVVGSVHSLSRRIMMDIFMGATAAEAGQPPPGQDGCQEMGEANTFFSVPIIFLGL